MDPAGAVSAACSARLPRTRGDGPRRSRGRPAHREASPHTRGWTRCTRVEGHPPPGFPAHAGMDPRRSRRATSSRRLPRTRGDGPPPAPHSRHDDRASPHTRGWTRLRGDLGVGDRGFPAHAGMDPAGSRRTGTAGRLPRTRGDGPEWFGGPDEAELASPHTRGWTRLLRERESEATGFPAHAGMDPQQRRGGSA